VRPRFGQVSNSSNSVTFTFRLLTISGGEDSSDFPQRLLLLYRCSDYRIPLGFSHLVVHAVFKLAPCHPLLGFQVNQREFCQFRLPKRTNRCLQTLNREAQIYHPNRDPSSLCDTARQWLLEVRTNLSNCQR